MLLDIIVYYQYHYNEVHDNSDNDDIINSIISHLLYINIRWGEEDVPGSPFLLNVEQ